MSRTARFTLMAVALSAVVAVACGRSAPADDGDARIATRVAEDRAVAATLTADAASAAAPTSTSTSTPTPQPTATPQPVAQQPTTAADTPTPTPTTAPPTAAPTAAPTATPIVAAVVPVDGSDGDGREILLSGIRGTNGRVIVLPGFDQSQVDSPMVFRDWLTARVFVFDTRLNRARDGNGIRSVRFEITKPDGDTFRQTENDAPFCLFGGSDPLCPGIRLRDQQRDWPAGRYDAAITIRANDGLESNWIWTFCVERCEEESSGPPVAEIVQIGRDSTNSWVDDALVFQVVAYDPAVGNRDGDGIRYVDFYILDSYGQQVYGERENDPAYCAFGGDTPCPAHFFADEGNRWPGGERVQNGTHQLVAIVVADNGESTQVSAEVDIQLP